MKKFGTPIGAGPGNAKLNVGFDADGTPPEPRNPTPGVFVEPPDTPDPPDPEVFDFDFDFDFFAFPELDAP
jgi:hypothetical protein